MSDHWDQRAREFGAEPGASWADVRAMEIEAHVIGKYACDYAEAQEQYNNKWLDVGCANGYLTEKMLAELPHYTLRECVDNSSEMVCLARARKLPAFNESVLQLDQPDESYGLITCVRTLQNLDCASQVAAVEEMKRVLAPGGLLLIIGEDYHGRCNLNSLRRKANLYALPVATFNHAENDSTRHMETVRHTDLYFYLTRFHTPVSLGYFPTFISLFSETASKLQIALNSGDGTKGFPMVGAQTLKLFRKETT